MDKRENQSTRTKRYTKQTIITLGIAIFFVTTTIAMNNFLIVKKDTQYQIVNNAYNFWQASQYLTSEARNYIVTGTRAHYDNYINEVNVTKRRDIAKEKMYQIGLSEIEKNLIENIGTISNDLVPLEEEAMQAVLSIGDFATARGILYGDYYVEQLASIEDNMMQLFSEIEERTERDVQRIQIIAFVFSAASIFCMIVVICVLLILVRFIREELLHPILKIKDAMLLVSQGNLSQPLDLQVDETEMGTLTKAIQDTKRFLQELISEMAEKLVKMAEGDFTEELKKDYIGEFAPIKAAVNRIVKDLSSMLLTLQEVSEQVNQGASQLAMASEDLAEGNTNQASIVEELAASMVTMEETVRKSVEEAKVTSETAQGAGAALLETNQKLEELKSAIGIISDRSEQIGEIIKVINEIASQTNLLALNASIEAARAGEAGRGFAVVANEINHLASNSRDTATQSNKSQERILNSTEVILKDTIQLMDTVGNINTRIENLAAATEEIAASADLILVTAGIVKESLAELVNANQIIRDE